MAHPYVPEDVRQFILTRIDSIAQIEALLLMKSSQQHAWSASEIGARLYISEAEAVASLELLRAGGLLVSVDGTYRLDGVSPQTAALVEKLLAEYSRHLVPVTNIVHSKSRHSGSFADVLKLRKGS